MLYTQTGPQAREEFNAPYNDTTYNHYTAYKDPGKLNQRPNSTLRSPRLSIPSIDLIARPNPAINAAYDCGLRTSSEFKMLRRYPC